MTRVSKLLAERAKTADQSSTIAKDMEALLAKASAENRDLNDDESTSFADLEKDAEAVAEAIKALDEKIAREKRLEAARAASATPVNVPGNQARATVPAQARYRPGKLKAFKGDTAAEDAYISGMFLRATMLGDTGAAEWCRERGIGIQKAHSEGSNTAGGFLVPTQFENAIIDLRETYGTFRGLLPVVPMASDSMSVPRRTGGLTAYFTGEAGAFTESEKSWGQVMLVAKKFGVLTKMSKELSEDAVISIADDLASEIAYAFAKKEDDCGWNGDGTSTYGGITGFKSKFVSGLNSFVGSVNAAAGHDTFAEIDANDLNLAIAALPKFAEPNAKWYCSQQAWALTFQRILAASGGNSMMDLAGKPTRAYLGYPVVIDQTLPTTTGDLSDVPMLYFGDLSLAARMGDRRGVSMQTLVERYAEYGQIGIIADERFDIAVHDIGDATNAGPLVALMGE
jgi:HK97 family phage major capsid protein